MQDDSCVRSAHEVVIYKRVEAGMLGLLGGPPKGAIKGTYGRPFCSEGVDGRRVGTWTLNLPSSGRKAS